MALQIWLPLNGNINNQGCVPTNPSTSGHSYTAGKIGQCTKLTTYLETNVTYDNWNFGSNSVSMGGWFKFNKSEVSTVVSNYTYTTTNPYPTGGLCGNYSYGGMGITWTGNNMYNSTAFSTMNIFGYVRCSSGMWTTGSTTVSFDTWTHYFLTFDKVNNKLNFYVNGSLISSVSTSSFDDTTFTHRNFAVNIKSVYGGNGPSYYIPMYVNDVRCYDSCLSLKEVKELSKGLVVHYSLADPYIEATTNINSYISQGISNTCYNGATGKYDYGTTTDMYKTTGEFNGKTCTKVYMGTAGLSAYPYIFFTPLHPSNGSYKTLSFDYFPTIGNTVNFYTYNGSATTTYRVNGGIRTSGTTILVNVNQWNHIELTLYGTSTATSGWGYMQTVSHTSTTSNYWLFANVQIEAKDHATAYTNSSRPEQLEYDSSGLRNNSTSSNITLAINNTPRNSNCYYFNNSHLASVPFPITTTTMTISTWVYTTNASATQCLLNARTVTGSGVALFIIGGKIRFDIGNQITFNWSISANTWYHLVVTSDGTYRKLYINGSLQETNSTTPSYTSFNTYGAIGKSCNTNYASPSDNILYGYLSDYRIYSSCLSASDIQELYNTPISVTNNGTIMTQGEVIEE